jgi:hypothetical protein
MEASVTYLRCLFLCPHSTRQLLTITLVLSLCYAVPMWIVELW